MGITDLTVKCLETDNAKYVFSVPGEETEDQLLFLGYFSIRFAVSRLE